MAVTSCVSIICSLNRPQMLHETVLSLVHQTTPCEIIVSVPDESHVLNETCRLPRVRLVTGSKGSCAQRNSALSSVRGECAAIFFFDDDVEVDCDYIRHMLAMLEKDSGVALAAGLNLGRGAIPGSLDREKAKRFIREKRASQPIGREVETIRAAIACRMCMRGSLLGIVRFDERLPLYGYQEDLDFSLQCRRYGRIVMNRRCLMVHIETNSGRMGSKRRGYSEVVNPFYIWSKKTGANLARVGAGSVRRTLRNVFHLHTADGRRQFAGNLAGWLRLATGRADPEYILRLE